MQRAAHGVARKARGTMCPSPCGVCCLWSTDQRFAGVSARAVVELVGPNPRDGSRGCRRAWRSAVAWRFAGLVSAVTGGPTGWSVTVECATAKKVGRARITLLVAVASWGSRHRMKKRYLIPTLLLTSTTSTAAPVPDEIAAPELLELRDQLLSSSRDRALEDMSYYLPLCDDEGFPLVGNVLPKDADLQPSWFCDEVRAQERRA